MKIPSRSGGFTVIELLLVIVLVLILGTLVAITASGVRAKDRNKERQEAINSIQGELETIYAQYNKYPTLGHMNSAGWRAENLKDFEDKTLEDPTWDSSVKTCVTEDKKIMLAAEPTTDCYSYQVTASDGSPCDNIAADCAHYTLTATLEGGDKYVKSSLN